MSFAGRIKGRLYGRIIFSSGSMFRTQVDTLALERLGATAHMQNGPASLAAAMNRVPVQHGELGRHRLDTMTQCMSAALELDAEATAVAAGVLLKSGDSRETYLRASGLHDGDEISQASSLLDHLAKTFTKEQWTTMSRDVGAALQEIV